MNADRRRRVREIAGRAEGLAAAERSDYLREACAGDDALRREVESLFASPPTVDSEETPLVPGASSGRHELAAGTRLGAYRITRSIGRGGMGAVYLAVRDDDAFEKQVAIKVVRPDKIDSRTAERFRRERQILADIEHPNIATLLDGGSTPDGAPYFVMQYIEGQRIDDYCDAHRLDVARRLELFRTVCAAVDVAHQHLIVHRDVKPNNILITADGTVKLLDFGIAKALAPVFTGETLESSAPGVRPMTPDFASPEQIRDGPLRPSSDVYSLGVLLYVLLSGHRPYRAVDLGMSEFVKAVCVDDPMPPSRVCRQTRGVRCRDGATRMVTPEAVSDARSTTPSLLAQRLTGDLDDIVCMAMQKRPERRYATAEQLGEDVRSHLAGERPLARGRRTGASNLRAGSRGDGRVLASRAIAVAAGSIALVALLWTLNRAASPPPSSPRSLSVVPPPGAQPWPRIAGVLDLSPSGDSLAFVAQEEGREPRLYLRRLDRFATEVLPGTEQAEGPFFSPDGLWLGFHAADRLMKTALGGGLPVAVTSTNAFLGGTWLEDGTIVFSDATRLVRVAETGGTPQTILAADLAAGEHFLRPSRLPGSRHVLVTVADDRRGRVVAVALDDGDVVELMEGNYPHARYAAPGYLLHGDGGLLFATPFDPSRVRITGPRVTLREQIATRRDGTGALFSVSEEGTLAYLPHLPDGPPRRQLIWKRRDGEVRPLSPEVRWFSAPRVSPAGDRAAVTVIENSRDYDIWLIGVKEESPQRLTFEGNNDDAVWSPDGKRIAFVSFRQGAGRLYTTPADGGEVRPLLAHAEDGEPVFFRYPSDWSPDGDRILFQQLVAVTQWDILAVAADGSGEVEPMAATAANEFAARFSPDGRWLAFVSDASGRDEVYVQPYPPTGSRWQLSEGGGVFPLWSGLDEIVYTDPAGHLVAASLRTDPAFSRGASRTLFSAIEFNTPRRPVPELDIGPDGTFLTWEETESLEDRWEIAVVLDLAAELRARARSVPRSGSGR